MLPEGKRRLLQVARARLSLSEDQYRAILKDHGDARSARDLDAQGFERVLDQFRRLGFATDRRKAGFGDRFGMATDAQVRLIRDLWAEVSGGLPEVRLNSWLEHFGVSALRFTTKDQAAKIIAALRAWKAREGTRREEAH